MESAHAGARHGRKDKRRQRDHPEGADWRQHGDVCLGSNGNPPCRGRGCCSEEEKEIIGQTAKNQIQHHKVAASIGGCRHLGVKKSLPVERKTYKSFILLCHRQSICRLLYFVWCNSSWICDKYFL